MVAHTVTPSIYYSGSFHAIAADVMQEESITCEIGYAEEGQIKPGKITWRFNDLSGQYDISNPLSPLYGIAARNTMYCGLSCDGAVRGVGEASSFVPDQDPEFTVGPPQRGRRWVDLEAQGILRRIGQWSKPLRSAMYRYISQYADLIGYWPCEDENGAVNLSNAAKVGLPGSVTSVDFAAGAGPGGSDTVLSVANGGRMAGTFPATTSATAGWQVAWSTKAPAVASATLLPIMTVYASNGYVYEIAISDTLIRMQVTDRDGIVVDTASTSYGAGILWTNWLTFRLKVTISAGTVKGELGWYSQDGSVLFGNTRFYAGTLGRPLSWRVSGNVNNANALYAHIFGITGGTVDLLASGALASFDGFINERSATRFLRLCDEEGITRTLIGTASDTMIMGRQRPDTLLNLIKEAADTDDAMVYDSLLQVGLTYRTRVSRYNQAAALALTFPGHVAVSMPKVLDDLGVFNRVTVSQRDGGEATASLLTGPMSVSTSAPGIGEYKRQVDVNVYPEDQLPLLAGWWLSRGTVPGARYPSVTVDLDLNPSLAAQCSAVRPGDLITVTGRTPDVLNLIAIGVAEKLFTHRRTITFTCIPADIFVVGVYDGTVRRLDSGTTTLNAGVAAGATALVFKITDVNDTWAVTGSGTPYDVIMAGERMTVTAMGAVTGAGPYTQNATVTRAVNGIAKAQLAAEVIDTFNSARYAL